jgi:hypothetical protein
MIFRNSLILFCILLWFFAAYGVASKGNSPLPSVLWNTPFEKGLAFSQELRLRDGKIEIEPAQALETWWDVDGPMPEVAGLT